MIHKKRKCPECGRKFVPRRDNQIYNNKLCKDRAGARRLRERAKNYDKLQADRPGPLDAAAAAV